MENTVIKALPKSILRNTADGKQKDTRDLGEQGYKQNVARHMDDALQVCFVEGVFDHQMCIRDSPGGIYETSLPPIEIKNAMVRNTKKVVLLADHSKFNESAMCLAVGFEDIDVVITDTGTPEDNVKRLRALGVEVKVV